MPSPLDDTRLYQRIIVGDEGIEPPPTGCKPAVLTVTQIALGRWMEKSVRKRVGDRVSCLA